jgi:FdhD protein
MRGGGGERRAGEAVVAVRVFAPGEPAGREDLVAVEEPLEVRIGGRPVAVLMRTPGHDEELVTGFLFGEGVIADADEVLGIEPPRDLAEADRGKVLEARVRIHRPLAERLFLGHSGCGICGKTSLASVEVKAAPVAPGVTVSRGGLAALPGRLRAAQPVFARTGGTHASGLFTPAGELVALREDVGRHNALDKLVGWALGEGRVPLSGSVLVVSGRVSYELVQKAVAAGAPVLAGVGAPSSLAVELAGRFGVTLIGFLSGAGMNVYTHPERVALT